MIILFACVTWVYAQELPSVDTTVLQRRLMDRLLRTSRLSHDELDSGMLGKSAMLEKSVHSRMTPRSSLRPPLSNHLPPLATDQRHTPSRLGPAQTSRRVSVFGLLHNDVHTLATLPLRTNELEAGLSMLRHLPVDWLRWYDRECIEFPLTAKAATSGVCYSIGDLCAQGIAGKNITTVDIGRSARSGAAGAIGYAPIAHHVLNFLDRSLSFGGAWWSVVPKIAIEEGPMSVVYSSTYSILMAAMQLQDPRHVLRNLKTTIKKGFIASIRIMPMVDLLTFTVIPVELQVLAYNVAEIIWVCIFSSLNDDDSGSSSGMGRDDEFV